MTCVATSLALENGILGQVGDPISMVARIVSACFWSRLCVSDVQRRCVADDRLLILLCLLVILISYANGYVKILSIGVSFTLGGQVRILTFSQAKTATLVNILLALRGPLATPAPFENPASRREPYPKPSPVLKA